MTDVKFGWRIPDSPVDDSRRSIFIDQITNTLNLIRGSFDSAWLSDHFIPWTDFQADNIDTLECWTTICYLAGAMPDLDFGTIVLCQAYRNPALLAKMAATLQTLTNGRFILGIGAGWKEDEYLAYGYEFPRASERIAQLNEAVQIIHKMWAEAPASFEGKFFRIKEAYCEPRPAPPPPIMIGGGGERLTLRIVAEQAAWWNLPGGSVENYAHKLEVLRSHCKAIGRDYDEIVKTWGAGKVVAIAETEAEAQRIAQSCPFSEIGSIVGTPDQVADYLRRFTALGAEYFILRFADFPHTAGIELFAETLIPQFK